MRRQSMNEAVLDIASQRSKKEKAEKDFKKAGWCILKKKETLKEKVGSELNEYFPMNRVSSKNSKF